MARGLRAQPVRLRGWPGGGGGGAGRGPVPAAAARRRRARAWTRYPRASPQRLSARSLTTANAVVPPAAYGTAAPSSVSGVLRRRLFMGVAALSLAGAPGAGTDQGQSACTSSTSSRRTLFAVPLMSRSTCGARAQPNQARRCAGPPAPLPRHARRGRCRSYSPHAAAAPAAARGARTPHRRPSGAQGPGRRPRRRASGARGAGPGARPPVKEVVAQRRAHAVVDGRAEVGGRRREGRRRRVAGQRDGHLRGRPRVSRPGV